MGHVLNWRNNQVMTPAIIDLMQWVETGVKPACDNFLTPASVADPDFGCTFTDGRTPKY